MRSLPEGGGICRRSGFSRPSFFFCHVEVKFGFWPSTVEILSMEPLPLIKHIHEKLYWGGVMRDSVWGPYMPLCLTIYSLKYHINNSLDERKSRRDALWGMYLTHWPKIWYRNNHTDENLAGRINKDALWGTHNLFLKWIHWWKTWWKTSTIIPFEGRIILNFQ